MLTRQQGQLALTHVLQVLFQSTDNNPLSLALAVVGYMDICQVIMMMQDEINALTYEDASKAVFSVPVPAQLYLWILKAYHAYQHEESDPIGDDWASIMVEEFDTFHIVDYIMLSPWLHLWGTHHAFLPLLLLHPLHPIPMIWSLISRKGLSI
jgi:hypothetical protein